MYKAFILDGYEVKGVTSVDFNNGRTIDVHNGLGQGNFPVADDKDLKSWVIKSQQEDSLLLDVLDNMLFTQEETRLVITSDKEDISELVYLESYSKSEEFSGVYEVSMKFIEYKEVGIKTTDMPYIARPGKNPKFKTKVINNIAMIGTTADRIIPAVVRGDMQIKQTEYNEAHGTGPQGVELPPTIYDANGKETNPCLIDMTNPKSMYYVDPKEKRIGTTFWNDQKIGLAKTINTIKELTQKASDFFDSNDKKDRVSQKYHPYQK